MTNEHPPAARPEATKPENTVIPDVREYGAARDGVKQVSDKRLFMQLLVFTGAGDPRAFAQAVDDAELESVLYFDANDPRGIGILLMSEDPDLFTGKARVLFNASPFSTLRLRPEFTMLGRTYSLGHEQDLEDWILKKPRRNVMNEAAPWHVWYPLRRKGEFEALPKPDQRPILMEHATIGMAWGAAGLANDVRLACHGLDTNDNEFVLGLVSKELAWISRLIQDMRRTQQTSKYIQSMGPFFVGRVFHRSKGGTA
jgi:chlorite dismutase